MKKSLLILLIAFGFCNYNYAQDCAVKLGVSANLLYQTPFYSLSFETDISEKASIEFGVNYTKIGYQNTELGENLDILHEGYGLTQNIKYKFFEYKDFATFVAPYISIHNINTKEEYLPSYSQPIIVAEYEGNIFLVTAGATVGFKYTFFNWLYVQADGGIGLMSYSTDIKDQNQDILSSKWKVENGMRIDMTGNIKIGYHFKI